jgi:rod shape-determining protein MreC
MNRRELSSERKYAVLVTVLFLNLVLVSTHVVLKDKRSLFQSVIGIIISPFQIAFQKTSDFVSHEFKHYVFLKDSFIRYHELKKKYTELKYQNYILRRKLIEQEFEKQAKEMARGKYNSFVKADVISIDRNLPLSSMMINRGSSDGIVKNMIVLNGEGHLVGKTVEPILPFSSKVRFITSPIGGVGAYIEKNLLEGLMTGNNTSICTFKYLIENKPVFKGDRVITSGTDEIYPPYIPIGEVVQTQKEYLTQKVYIKPYFVEKSFKQLIVIGNVKSGQGQNEQGKKIVKTGGMNE